MEPTPERRENVATLRFYAELCDFLAPSPRGSERTWRFSDNPSVKAAIEGCGVPHTEVDLILVNGESVDFGHPLTDGDRVSVYPVFETLDIGALARLRERPLRDVRFVLDANLGKLARRLRLLGFDTDYRNDFGDAEIVAESVRTGRILLTRNRRLLQHAKLTHGYWVRSDKPDVQVVEVLRRFQIERVIRPFSRCLDCNGPIAPVPKSEVAAQLEPKTRLYYDEFRRCACCAKIYWRGTHYDRLLARLRRVVGVTGNEPSGADGS